MIQQPLAAVEFTHITIDRFRMDLYTAIVRGVEFGSSENKFKLFNLIKVKFEMMV